MGSLTTITGDRVYLDTNLFIYAMEGLSDVVTRLTALFQRFDRGELHAVTSELTLAECLVKPIRDGATAVRAQYERMLSSSPSLTVIPISRQILIDAATLRARGALKLPDAIHAATSLANGCTTHLTNDRQFVTVAPLPVLLLADLR
jgi:predicted nucleic acid-binding protein